MDLCDEGSKSSRHDRSWRVVLWMWAAAAALVWTAPPGAWCQQNVSFTFLPGDTGFNCTSYCDMVNSKGACATNPGCGIINSALQLIPFDGSISNQWMAARYMRNAPVRLWNASFWTFFVLRVSHPAPGESPSLLPADGMTFLIAPNTSTPAGSVAGNFGLLNNSGDSQIVAVAFDTFNNSRDPPTPYVGLLVNGLAPSRSRTLAGALPVDFLGNSFGVWVEYNATSELMEVSMAEAPAMASSSSRQAFGAAATTLRRNATSMFVSPINVTAWVAEVSYLGFSAGSGFDVEINEVLYWQFETGASSAPAGPAPTGPAPAPALAPALGRHSSSGTATIAVPIAASLAGAAVVCGALLVFWWCTRGGRKHGPLSLEVVQSINAGPRVFSYDELRRATGNFKGSSLLGEGGFGKVFRGQLSDGTSVAVKRVSEGSRQGEKEFLAEVNIIGRLRHKNLVPLLGWCQNQPKGELLLVYEFMPNGSLDQYVLRPRLDYSSSGDDETALAAASAAAAAAPDPSPTTTTTTPSRPGMSWDARYHVLQGVASALQYLHEDWQEGGVVKKQAVVHRDIKSSNVLLDADWNARLGDFGLARMVDKNRSAQTASNVVGTLGYLAPEYPHTRKISVQADVYSFGMVVLEVVTGRRPVEWSLPPSQRVLLDWIRSVYQGGAAAGRLQSLEDAADPALGGIFSKEQVVLLLRLGLLCTAYEPGDRPSMRQVVQYLATGSGDAGDNMQQLLHQLTTSSKDWFQWNPTPAATPNAAATTGSSSEGSRGLFVGSQGSSGISTGGTSGSSY